LRLLFLLARITWGAPADVKRLASLGRGGRLKSQQPGRNENQAADDRGFRVSSLSTRRTTALTASPRVLASPDLEVCSSKSTVHFQLSGSMP
jgi:hypothetical protein